MRGRLGAGVGAAPNTAAGTIGDNSSSYTDTLMAGMSCPEDFPPVTWLSAQHVSSLPAKVASSGPTLREGKPPTPLRPAPWFLLILLSKSSTLLVASLESAGALVAHPLAALRIHVQEGTLSKPCTRGRMGRSPLGCQGGCWASGGAGSFKIA